MSPFDRLVRIADRLAVVKAGSAVADRTIHQAIDRSGPVPPYTTDEAAARTLLPSGFEWITATFAAGRVYAPCRRSGRDADTLPFPHHGQWGRTLPLSMCGAAMRAWALLAKA
ncbi:hypothetical protein JMJ56_31835 [Belnapia sp. T18]|uniref:Uncharacterized protein n=1 Tax=Belnapia arida TaxID=2804533 RepID=A0ABS1UD10_9PROT|nr:hypothetical protein [Belnapia arida]MBL6082558.1 hypothetical protein [Belnapia arida]